MDKTLRFGIEIETVGASKEALANAIKSVVGGEVYGTTVRAADGRDWKVVHDASLSGYNNGEVVSPILGYDDLETVQNIVRALREAGGRSDSSCGIHYALAVVMRSPGAKPKNNSLAGTADCA
jgi:hypothetical protein